MNYIGIILINVKLSISFGTMKLSIMVNKLVTTWDCMSRVRFEIAFQGNFGKLSIMVNLYPAILYYLVLDFECKWIFFFGQCKWMFASLHLQIVLANLLISPGFMMLIWGCVYLYVCRILFMTFLGLSQHLKCRRDDNI